MKEKLTTAWPWSLKQASSGQRIVLPSESYALADQLDQHPGTHLQCAERSQRTKTIPIQDEMFPYIG